MAKKLCALLAGALFLTAGLSAAAFSDVSEGDWHHGAVQYVTAAGFMGGVGQDRFAPQELVTRGTVVTALYRVEGSPAASPAAPFSDVADGQWYAAAAAWAKGAGIASGYESGAFGPNDAVTREQLAVFLYRYAQYKGMERASGVLGGYADGDRVSPWAEDAVSHAVGAGILTGKGGGILDPAGTAMRAELAAMLQRLMTPAIG